MPNDGATRKETESDPNRDEPAVGLVDLTLLIRGIQRAEGYEACFRTDRFDCAEQICAWRSHCFRRQRSEPS